MEALAPLVASLRRWGLLRTDAVALALEELDWDHLLPDVPGREGGLYAPTLRADGSLDLSPRASVLLAELLELGRGLCVALPIPRPRILEGLVVAMGARVYDPLHDHAADRTLELTPVSRAVPLVDGGFALEVGFEPFAESLSKRMQGETAVRMGLEQVALIEGQIPPRPLKHLLAVEGFMRRILEDRPRTRQDEAFVQGVADVWDPRAKNQVPGRIEWARRWFTLAYVHQFSADLLDAAALYRASIDACPTAEAHTLLGWVHHQLGDDGAAIEECLRAIAVDPGFGNAHNDLGAYMVDLGRPREAVAHLERALAADRYSTPHFAYCNLGRAYLALSRPAEARRALEKSLALEPGYLPARKLLEHFGR